MASGRESWEEWERHEDYQKEIERKIKGGKATADDIEDDRLYRETHKFRYPEVHDNTKTSRSRGSSGCTVTSGISSARPGENKVYKGSYADALALCESDGNQALYMPGVARARINGLAKWDTSYDSRSVRVTGTSKSGEAFVLYVHTNHPLATSEGVRAAKMLGFVNGAARFPQEAFLQLLERDGETANDGTYRVKAVPHDRWRKSPSGIFSIDDALDHLQTIPFFGSEALAEQYLKEFRKHKGNNIEIWYSSGDLDKETPLSRPLFVYGGRDSSLKCRYGGLYNGVTRLLGVRASDSEQCAEGARKISAPAATELQGCEASVSGPTLDEIIELFHDGRALRYKGRVYVEVPDDILKK